MRTGDVSIASTDVVKAQAIKISADGDPSVAGDGKLDVAGTLDASGEEAGRIELFAKNDVNVKSTAKLAAASSGANEDGGDIVIGTRDGQLNLEASDPGKGIDVSGGAGGQGGTVLLRAPRIKRRYRCGGERTGQQHQRCAFGDGRGGQGLRLYGHDQRP